MIKTVYLVHHTHVDIGYTHSQPTVLRRHLEIIDRVLDYCRETDSYPDGSRFAWTCETSWTAMHYIRSRPGRTDEFVQRVREGRIELTCLYLNVTELYSIEELIRSMYVVKELEDQTGVKIVSAMNSDVPGMAWAIPQLLAQTGIKYLSMAANRMRSLSLAVPQPFYWESPDGSRVLAWNAEKELWYALGYALGFADDCEALELSLPAYLRKIEDRGYPYEAVCIRAGLDNDWPRRAISAVATEWNSRHPDLLVRVATNREFFEAIAQEAVDRIPSYRLAWPDWWADGHASAAYETGLSRDAHRRLLAAEALFTLASLGGGKVPYPRDELKEAWDALMFFDEHTWGYTASIREPHSLMTRGQWVAKSYLAHKGAMMARELLDGACEAAMPLCGAPRSDGETVVVFNPLPFERTDVACLPLGEEDGGDGIRLFDADCELPRQIDEGSLRFLASGVPSAGSKTYSVVRTRPSGNVAVAPVAAATREECAVRSFPEADDAIENQSYRLSLDRATGAIVSAYDKELGRELVDQKSPYALNQLIYERIVSEGGRRAIYDHMSDLGALEAGYGWGQGHRRDARFDRCSPEVVSIRSGKDGPVAASVLVELTMPSVFRAVQEITLYRDLKRIEIETTIDKQECLEPEGLYCAFPFALCRPVVRIETAGAVIRPEEDQLPGSGRDYYSMQECMSLSDGAVAVVLACREAPLVHLQEINTGRWLEATDLENGTVFSWLMNNYWFTNFRASQAGRVVFHYSITSLAPPVTDQTCLQFGYGANLPLAARKAADEGRYHPGFSSLCKIIRGAAIITSLKLAEDGRGLIVRLQVLPGNGGSSNDGSLVELEFPRFQSVEAHRCTVIEDVTGELPVFGNVVQVNAREHEIVTVRVTARGPSSPLRT